MMLTVTRSGLGAPFDMAAFTASHAAQPVQIANLVQTPSGFVPIQPPPSAYGSADSAQPSFWSQNKALVIGTGLAVILAAVFAVKAW